MWTVSGMMGDYLHTSRIQIKEKAYSPSKVVCIGKNYEEHIKEMGGGKRADEPVIFIKPASAIVYNEKSVDIPLALGLLHHEVELCFLASKRCKDVSESVAAKAIGGWAVGIDFTLRQRQNLAKKAGEPWALAKGFDSSCVLGEFAHPSRVKDPLSLEISLRVNGKERQKSNTTKMITSPASMLSYVSKFMTVEEGDVLMCGTPEGVGEVLNGDKLYAYIEGLPILSFKLNRR